MIKFFINLIHYGYLWLLLIALQGAKYDWMSEIDPSIQPGDIVDDSGDRATVKVMMVTCMVILQTIILGVAQRRHERKLALLLMAVAVVTYCVTR